ncbi:hypothetical protein ACWDG1_47655 [Streptomyces sp. NPDC001177]
MWITATTATSIIIGYARAAAELFGADAPDDLDLAAAADIAEDEEGEGCWNARPANP